ncbi:MAG: helix-turn-helix transcriptional regulator [Anaerolineales bacterium]|nr:helix-turn-helix transcriptional regulator [Anaerolineales bacterium]
MSPMSQRPIQIENVLLGFLDASPQHGYSLHQRLIEPGGLGRVWRVKQSQLYALLEKLESAGFITSEVQAQEALPARRVYSITEAGRSAYREWLTTAVSRPHQVRQEFLAKLYFALNDPPAMAALLENQQRACNQWRSALLSDREALPPQANYDRLVIDFRLAQVEMIRSFLKEIIP